MEMDIRWKQRFSNFQKAFHKLSESIDFIKKNESKEFELIFDEMLKEGLIQRFEYTHELAWKVMKDYIQYQGNTEISGSRDATKEAFQIQLISDGDVWMEMIGSRNMTSHTYNEETANEIFTKIINEYFLAFSEFKNKMQSKL